MLSWTRWFRTTTPQPEEHPLQWEAKQLEMQLRVELLSLELLRTQVLQLAELKEKLALQEEVRLLESRLNPELQMAPDKVMQRQPWEEPPPQEPTEPDPWTEPPPQEPETPAEALYRSLGLQPEQTSPLASES